MSFEILEADGATTVYAPLNTTIDADSDYYGLTGLDACACGGQPGYANRQQLMPLNQQLQGTYQDYDMPDGMVNLGEDEVGIKPLRLLVLGGVIAGMWWAFKNRHELGW